MRMFEGADGYTLLALMGLDPLESPLADGGAEMRYEPFA